tara:strand:+ start:991 stop:1299 length:309 start_codon:yes stop_codon:yes gene_type:complete
MAATITWKVRNCESTASDGCINEVKYTIYGVDGDYSARRTVFTRLDSKDDDNFITYNNVTEANVLAWVKSKLGSNEVTLLENAVKKDIALAKAPTKTVGTPW